MCVAASRAKVAAAMMRCLSLQGLTNVLWTAVFVGSAAYIARKDLAKVFRVLRTPTENFIKDVRSELDKAKPMPGPSSPPSLPGEAQPGKPAPTGAAGSESHKL